MNDAPILRPAKTPRRGRKIPKVDDIVRLTDTTWFGRVRDVSRERKLGIRIMVVWLTGHYIRCNSGLMPYWLFEPAREDELVAYLLS